MKAKYIYLYLDKGDLATKNSEGHKKWIIFKITNIFCINNSLFNHKAISRKINILKDLILNKSFM